MGTNQNPKETQKNSFGPSSAKAYLDPHYWYLFVFFTLFPYLPLEFSLISSTASCCLFRDERFSNEEHYEWFKDYSHFRHLIQAHIKPNSSVPFLSLSLLLYIIFIGLLIGIACVEFANF